MLCRVEEAYLDAYEGEGWRGANREKLRPTAELEQARLQVPFYSLPFLLTAGLISLRVSAVQRQCVVVQCPLLQHGTGVP